MAPRRVVMVAMPCAEVMEIGGTLDVFYAANVLLAEAGASDPGYAVEVVSPVPTVRSWPGLCIKAERSYRDVRGPIDTLIITGTDTADEALKDAALVTWLTRMAPRTRRLVGMCTGTFLLAAAGLLDGRRATSHWMFCDELARLFPNVRVERDSIYGHVFRQRLKGMRVGEVLTAPHSPWQNPFAERLIGSIRRDCLNHVVVLGERHLRRTLARYFAYYHGARTLLSLDKAAPHGRPIERPELGRIIPIREVGGLHHRYIRWAA